MVFQNDSVALLSSPSLDSQNSQDSQNAQSSALGHHFFHFFLKKHPALRLHFVGIGGIGMSGIAEVFLHQGLHVSGSDLQGSETTQKLIQLGAKIHLSHQAQHVHGASVVVQSSAITAQNEEIQEAKRLRIPVISRAEMLGELMREKIGIAVAGSHGKTTTTSMLAMILSKANLDPTIIIGGKVDALGGHARRGNGRFIVAEADESDGSFLLLPYTYTIITNIDNDHLDFYRNQERVVTAFIDFVKRAPFYGKAFVCGDDPGVLQAISSFSKPYELYGFQEHNTWVAHHRELKPRQSFFEVDVKGKYFGSFELNIPGEHNILNALGCIALAAEIHLPLEEIQQGLKNFKGTQQRFQIRYESITEKQVIIDDYAHHPTEIKATLKCAKTFWDGRIICVFQPHRYTRLAQCWHAFLSCFERVDHVFVCDIYSAGELPLPHVTSEAFVKAYQAQKVTPPMNYTGSLQETEAYLLNFLQPHDAVIFLGAGSITKIAQSLSKTLKKGIACNT